jgi:hypothetical protein
MKEYIQTIAFLSAKLLESEERNRRTEDLEDELNNFRCEVRSCHAEIDQLRLKASKAMQYQPIAPSAALTEALLFLLNSSPELRDETMTFLRSLGHESKISAIKHVRDLTGLGLLESKELVMKFWKD